MVLTYPEGYEFLANLHNSEGTSGKKYLPLPESAFADCESLKHLKDWKYQVKKKGRHCDHDLCTNTFIIRMQSPDGTIFVAEYEFNNGGGLVGFGETLEFSRLTAIT